MQVRCVVTDGAGNSVNSNAATITVIPAFAISRQPECQRIILGQSLTLSLKATGDSLQYQWYFKKDGQTAFSPWNGHIHATETATPNVTWDGIELYCRITDASGHTLDSDSVIVSVLSIASHPRNVTVAAGSNATFTVETTGLELYYQWQYRKKGQTAWNNWGTRTAASTTATANATWDGMQVRCVVTDDADNTVYSNPATITIASGITVTQQPKNQSISLGKSVTLSVKATGDSLQYQWYYKKKGQSSFSVWNGRTHASETVTPNATWDGIQLYSRVTDASGKTVDSDTVTVSVLSIAAQPQNVTVETGSNATFTVKATGSDLKYQWQYKKAGAASWSNWGARTTASTTAASNATWNGMQVRCIVTDGASNTVISNAAVITIR